MKNSRWFPLAGALLVCGLLAGPMRAEEMASADQQAAAKARSSQILKVAITRNFFTNFPEKIIKLVMQPFPEIVKKQTDLPGSIDLCAKSTQLADQLAKGECHLAVFNSHEFLWARAKNPKLKPLMLAENKTTPLKAYLVVNKADGINNIAQLEKKEVCVPGNSRPFAETFLQYQCCKPGQSPKDFYSSLRKTDDAEEALDSLADGKTQAVLVEKAAWDRYQKRKPNMASNLDVVKESEDFIPAVIAYIPEHMPNGWSDIFRKGMISANDNPATSKLMMLVKISSFLEVPENFEDRAAEMLKRYPPSGN